MVEFLILVLSVVGLLVTVSNSNLKGSDLGSSMQSKVSYECGYEDLSGLVCYYSMQFYIVSLSFMIFDLEVLLVLPLVMSTCLGTWGFSMLVGFLCLVVALLFYELIVSVLSL